jgi:DNA-binding GntR family transcriptional regulator
MGGRLGRGHAGDKRAEVVAPRLVFPGARDSLPRSSEEDQMSSEPHKDAYDLILEAIDVGVYRPGDRLVESELAERFGVSRTPIREALQRLETQSLLARDGRSLIVASLDHSQLSELYVVRSELEGLAARLAARHATKEEIEVLEGMVASDQALIDDPGALARANRRFHRQIHLASHNRYLYQQLDLVYRTMALMATTSLAATGRGAQALEEHARIVAAIRARDEQAAYEALKNHISIAFVQRLKTDSERDVAL